MVSKIEYNIEVPNTGESLIYTDYHGNRTRVTADNVIRWAASHRKRNTFPVRPALDEPSKPDFKYRDPKENA